MNAKIQALKKIYVLILLNVTFAVPTLFATSYTVSTVGGYGPFQTGQGGEFTLKTSDDFLNDFVAGYANETKNQYGSTGNQPNFQTFCVEGNEHIGANTAYEVVLNDHSVYSGNYLSKGAAYLYSQFAQGTLAGYDYGSGRLASADQLQRAVWALMGGQVGQSLSLSNPFQALTASVFGDLNAASDAAVPGDYGVYILNMWSYGHVGENAYKAQDQLIWSPKTPGRPNVPDGGTTAGLLGLGLAGIELIARRIRR